jgi:hypothetical protein
LIAPLFGCTSDSQHVALFATVSFEFGGAESKPVGAFSPAPGINHAARRCAKKLATANF